MNRIIPAALAFLLPSAALAQTMANCNPADPNQVRLQVSVTGMRNAKGNVTITIYPDDAKHFLDGKFKVARQILPVTLPVTKACFALPAPGYYAVTMFHDENDNHHYDTSLLGIPEEGYGFSRNPRLVVGPPGLDEVRVPLKAGDNPVAVQMRYYL